jgi:hypothetical protein
MLRDLPRFVRLVEKGSDDGGGRRDVCVNVSL